MIRRILVPLDGSEVAEAVLPYVEDLAKRLRAEIYLVRIAETSVQEILAFGMGAPCVVEAMEEAEQVDREEAKDYLARVADRLRGGDIHVSWEIVEGRAADTIVELADADKIDLIAMSTHGRTGLDRVIFGSVAEEVLRSIGIPVLLVRPELKADQQQG